MTADLEDTHHNQHTEDACLGFPSTNEGVREFSMSQLRKHKVWVGHEYSFPDQPFASRPYWGVTFNGVRQLPRFYFAEANREEIKKEALRYLQSLMANDLRNGLDEVRASE